MILQKTLPYDPFAPKPLPGIMPLKSEDWLKQDDCAAAQIDLRQRLIEERAQDVLALAPAAMEAAQELLEHVAAQLFPGQDDVVSVSDGTSVQLDYCDPMRSLGRIAQQDFCILQKPEGADEHVLTGAVLCFPASWRLADKFMRPLTQIHVPVPEYDAQIAKRVQRLFDGVQVGRPLWRFNALWYDSADLYHPDRDPVAPHLDRNQAGQFLRSELQSILRLPKTQAVVFSIHTRVLSRADALAMSRVSAEG
ncbi:heme-dependent oxidative N-demethylase family protein [Tritonibacter litoralis]|nr:DUF3445 domain-containing protein [Tritonibacter litoralis]